MTSAAFGVSPQELARLISDARGGESVAQERLFGLCVPVVSRYMAKNVYPATSRWIQREELVAWVVEETLCSLDQLPEGPADEALLIRLNRLAFERTRDSRRNHRQLLGDSVLPTGRSEAALPEPSEGPVTSKDEKQLLAQLINALPEQYARVVDLHLRDGLGFAEVGEVLGLTADGAYRRYKRARDLLIERLESKSNGQ